MPAAVSQVALSRKVIRKISFALAVDSYGGEYRLGIFDSENIGAG